MSWAKTVKELTSLSEIFNHSVFFPIYSHRWSEKRWTFVTHIYFRFLAYLHFICGFLSWFPQFLYFYRRQFSLFEFLVPDKAQDTQATTSTFSHLPSNTHCLPETLHNLCLFLFLLDISPGYYRLPKRMKLIRTPTPRAWVACEQQTHFRSSLLSLRKIFGGRSRSREATTGNASAVRRLEPGGQEIVIGKLYKDISIWVTYH